MAADESQRILRELVEAIDAGRPVVLATVVATRRSVPRHAGTKMLVYGDGRLSGTVGGGEMESRVIQAAQESLQTGATQLLTYDLVDPGAGDPGVCGGTVEIYVEPAMPPPTVLVAGAGHVGKAVVELAHWLGFRTIVTDDRPEEVDEALVPLADVRLSGSIDDALAAADGGELAVVLVSRSVDYDVASLPAVLHKAPRYVGVMGSSRRWGTTRGRLAAAGLTEEALAGVRAPIGHEIGAETVEEIAVSIMAEVIAAFRDQR
ncbi:MAG TPA: XdhC family protein [Acidimicrobiia bacterium]|nr:XdhC family protein [Acidimicrobiia bacterium]